MTQGWIIKDKLPGFVELLAFIAGAKNDWDLEVIVSGLHGTDDERDEWFEYEMVGEKRRLALRFADDPESSVSHVQIVATQNDVIELFKLAILACSSPR